MTDDNMIPQTGAGIDPSAFAIEQMPSYTYRLDETGRKTVGFAGDIPYAVYRTRRIPGLF